MGKKIKVSEVVFEVLELGKENFPDSNELTEIRNIFEKIRFGEIVLKIVDGDIETIQVTNNYKPVKLVDKED